MSGTTLKTIAFALVPTIIAVLVFALGVFAGRYITISPLKKQIVNYSKSETLGRMLPSQEERKRRALAFYDSEAAMQEMDNFSWAVPNVLTPFVGNGPRPGKNDNALINSMQFRADKEVTMPKPDHVYRIFITGGSTAYGSGAPDQERIIGGYLERILNTELSPITKMKYEVFTMANPAWASTHERIIVENRLSELEPDMVISYSGNNDVHWGRLGRNVLWFRSYADQHFWDMLNTAYESAGYSPMPEVVEVDSSPIRPSVVADRLEKNIRLICFTLSMQGARYVFVLQPNLFVSTKPLTAREHELLQSRTPAVRDYFSQCYAELESRLAALSIGNFAYVDQSDIFGDFTDKDEIFLDSCHFGDRGNEIVARRLFERLRSIIEE